MSDVTQLESRSNVAAHRKQRLKHGANQAGEELLSNDSLLAGSALEGE